MKLLNLSPDIQDELLISWTVAAEAAVPERVLRPLTAVVGWSQQRKLWKELRADSGTQR